MYAQDAYAEVKFPGNAPGKAAVECTGTTATLENKMFSASFRKAGKGAVFDGLKLADGTEYSSRTLDSTPLEEVKLEVDKKHPKLAHRLAGKAIRSTFTTPDKALEIQWQAVLRNGSHYLRQELEVKARKDTTFEKLTPLVYNIQAGGTPELSGNTTHGKVVVNDLIFCGLEPPMSAMSVPGGSVESTVGWTPDNWKADNFAPVFNEPAAMTAKYGNAYAEKDGPVVRGLAISEGEVAFQESGSCKIDTNGGLNVVAVQIFPKGSTNVASEDVHKASQSSTYTLDVPEAGSYTLKIWVDTKKAEVSGEGTLTYSLPLKTNEKNAATGPTSVVQGDWVRSTTLHKGQTWETSSVLGFFAPEQKRRSFLAYSERERAAAYRLFIHYNDWYEIGITINNNQYPLKRNSEKWQLNMLETWKSEMFQKRKTPIDCFVIDDGWAFRHWWAKR